jgi:nickel/cobalt transporter (NicO) family protein
MTNELTVLIPLAASIGFIHTLIGPDHYLPFIVISKARNWSMRKTALITFICGVGHVLSSVVLGFIGIGLGIAVLKLEFIEGLRGELAAWLLISFGFVYFIWGMRNALKGKKHSHLHIHEDGTSHYHIHGHYKEHAHVHPKKSMKELTPWILFMIFVFGPCEPLIPILMYPAAIGSIYSVALIAFVFSSVTILTMMTIVLTTVYGAKFINMRSFEKYGNAIAGFMILASGLAIKFLGL